VSPLKKSLARKKKIVAGYVSESMRDYEKRKTNEWKKLMEGGGGG